MVPTTSLNGKNTNLFQMYYKIMSQSYSLLTDSIISHTVHFFHR